MSEPLFSMDDIVKQSHGNSDKKQAAKLKVFDKKHFQSVNNIHELLSPPGEGEIYFIWTLRSFNAFSFINYFLEHKGKIDDLIITTYNISRIIISALMRLIDENKIDHLTLFLSDAAKSLFPKSYNELMEQAKKRPDKVKFHYAWNHSKVTLINIGKEYFILEGSGNFSENSRHEQYILINDKETYEFRKQWILAEIDTISE